MENQTFYSSYYAQIDARGFQWREMGGAAKAKNIVDILGDTRVESILDVGCGTGAVLHGLEEKGFGSQFYALDVAEEAVAYTRQRSDLPQLVEAKWYDGEHIPYPDQSFDLAVLSHVIEHLEDPARLIEEVARVAKYIVVEVPLEANIYTWAKVKILRSRYREEIGHVQLFSPRSFRSLLENRCGLKILKIRAAFIPDEQYYFRKKGFPQKLTGLQLMIRKILRSLSMGLYLRLLTDHMIALTNGYSEAGSEVSSFGMGEIQAKHSHENPGRS